jgi:hypothetical protein
MGGGGAGYNGQYQLALKENFARPKSSKYSNSQEPFSISDQQNGVGGGGNAWAAMQATGKAAAGAAGKMPKLGKRGSQYLGASLGTRLGITAKPVDKQSSNTNSSESEFMAADEFAPMAIALTPDQLATMQKGVKLLKFGRRGRPSWRHFQLSADMQFLQWGSARKAAHSSRVSLYTVDRVQRGQVLVLVAQPSLA